MQQEKKTRQLHIRLTEEEWLIINSLADRAGMTVTAFVIRSILDSHVTVNEIDTHAILRPLLGLQRHYNTIRHWMIQNDYDNPILDDEYEEELRRLWQLLAQAKAPVAQRVL